MIYRHFNICKIPTVITETLTVKPTLNIQREILISPRLMMGEATSETLRAKQTTLRVRLRNFRPLDTGSKINPALNFVCGLRNPCLSSIQKGFVSNFKRFRYLGNFTCVRRSTKLASLQHTKISHLCHVLALSKMIQSEIYSAGLQFITLAQHL